MIVGAWSIKIIIVLTIGSIIILSCKRVRLYSNITSIMMILSMVYIILYIVRS